MIAHTPIDYEKWNAFCEADPVGACMIVVLLTGLAAGCLFYALGS